MNGHRKDAHTDTETETESVSEKKQTNESFKHGNARTIFIHCRYEQTIIHCMLPLKMPSYLNGLINDKLADYVDHLKQTKCH